MAYGVKWFSEFDDIQENVVYSVEVLERGFSGTPIEVTSSGEPITISQEKVDNPFISVRPQKASVTWISDETSNFEISDLFITDDRKYQLKVYQYNGASKTAVWSGYLVPVDCEAPYASRPFPVNFSATCGLPFLNDVEFLSIYGDYVRGKLPLIKILAHCLSSTGYELPIDTYVDLFDEGMAASAQSALQLAEIDADGLRGMKASEVLSGILSAFGAFVTQVDNKWIIQGVREQNSINQTLRAYTATGDFIGSSVVDKSAVFGRDHEIQSTPSFRALGSEVNERLAEPNSIVTETVSPGIPVNRLFNGEFASPVLGGNIQGWNNRTVGGTSWARDGSGRPGDPYRLVYNSHIEFNLPLKKNKFRPFSYFDTGPIEINVGDFNVKAEDRPDVKIVFSGSVKMNNALLAAFHLTLNEQEREYASFLKESGEWFYSKKEDAEFVVKSTQAEHGPVKGYNDLEYQTFRVESQDITNFVKAGSEAKAFIRLRVFPGIQGPGYHGNQVFLSIEDLSLTIETGLKFEADHKYQVDGKLPIRNANEVEFTTIIGDKINIDTPEQKRDVNRVMTGYMTIAGGNALTKGWKRSSVPGDAYEPIQIKSLRDRIRQLCGKRQVVEGAFIGYGLKPDQTVINSFESDKRYSVTGWDWDLKNSVFEASFNELGFSQLMNEDVYLYDEESGRRSGRSAGSGSTGGGLTPIKPAELIVLDEPEPYEYEILIEDEEDRVCGIQELIQSSHIVALLDAKILYHPDWITEISLYRGEDLTEEEIPESGILQVLWKGKPVKSGDYQILVELSNEVGADYILSIPLVVEPSEDFIESWPPVFIDLPPLYFIAGKTATKEVKLADYLDPDGEHDGTGLNPRLLSTPYWVSKSTIVFMYLSVTGTPDKPGTYWVTYELSDAVGRTTTIAFEVIVLDPSFMTYELLDTSGSTPVLVGKLPGVYELPTRWDVAVRVKGDHDYYKFILKGGGANASTVNKSLEETILQTADGEYKFFKEDNGVVTEAGQFSLSADTYLAKNFIFGETIDFVLYDEEFLEAIKFFLVKGGVSLGELVQDGTSSFLDPETGNFTVSIADIEHDKAVISFDLVEPVEQTHTTPVTSFDYVFDTEDFPIDIGQHTVTITLYLDDEQVATRYAKFETVADKPKPVAGLKLVTMIPNTTDYTVLSELPETGGSLTLPENWNVLSDAESEEYDYEKVEIWELRGGSLVEINTSTYTRQPNYNEFIAPVTKSNFFVFRELNSLKIGSIHKTPSTFRVLVTRRIGGATGEIVAILKSDFSFGPAVDIDDSEVTQPGDNIIDYMAGDGLDEEIEDFIKTFNVNVDNVGIEIFSTNNWLRLKDKGVTFAKVQDVPTMTLLGRTTAGNGVISAVPIVTNLTTVSDATIPTSKAVKDAVAAGTTWQAVMTKGSTSNIVPTVSIDTSVTPRAYAIWSPTDYAIGKPQVRLVKTVDPTIWELQVWEGVETGTLNIRSTYLQHNGINIVKENRLINTGTGLSGGGNLSTNRTITFDTTWGDARYTLSTRNITINGTTGRITSSAGVQNLTQDRTWTLDLATVGTAGSYRKVTVDAYGRVTAGSNPTTVAEYGLTDVYTKTLADERFVPLTRTVTAGTGLSGGGSLSGNISVSFDTVWGDARYALKTHSHVSTDITDFTAAVRGKISGTGDISYNSTTGVISYTGGAGTGTVGGSGTAGFIAQWATGGVNLTNSVIQDISGEIRVGNTRNFAVLGIMAVRNKLNVWEDTAIGHTDTHGTLFIHKDSSATIHGSAALEIRSTTKVFIPSRMTLAQLSAISNPVEGMIAYAATTLGSTAGYLWVYRRTESGTLMWDIATMNQP